jgi:formate hydrogenlyase transcriptional activator
MSPKASPAASWLVDNGPKELELLFRAIIYHPATPILITDSDRNYREASAGAGKLLGVPRAKIIGRQLDDFTPLRRLYSASLQAKSFAALAGVSGTR